MLRELLKLIEVATPIYGDIQINRYFAKYRADARRQIQEIKVKDKKLDEREKRFRQELSDLLEKYDIWEERGSYLSYYSQYVPSEEHNLGSIVLSSTILPELIIYTIKYSVYTLSYYNLF